MNSVLNPLMNLPTLLYTIAYLTVILVFSLLLLRGIHFAVIIKKDPLRAIIPDIVWLSMQHWKFKPVQDTIERNS